MKLVQIGTRGTLPVWVAPEKVLGLCARLDGGTEVQLQTGAASTVSATVDDAVGTVAHRLNEELTA